MQKQSFSLIQTDLPVQRHGLSNQETWCGKDSRPWNQVREEAFISRSGNFQPLEMILGEGAIQVLTACNCPLSPSPHLPQTGLILVWWKHRVQQWGKGPLHSLLTLGSPMRNGQGNSSSFSFAQLLGSRNWVDWDVQQILHPFHTRHSRVRLSCPLSL